MLRLLDPDDEDATKRLKILRIRQGLTSQN